MFTTSAHQTQFRKTEFLLHNVNSFNCNCLIYWFIRLHGIGKTCKNNNWLFSGRIQRSGYPLFVGGSCHLFVQLFEILGNGQHQSWISRSNRTRGQATCPATTLRSSLKCPASPTMKSQHTSTALPLFRNQIFTKIKQKIDKNKAKELCEII